MLIYLYRHGKTSVNSILAQTGMSKDTFYNAVNRLVTLNFAYKDSQTGFPTYVYLGLTKAGEDVARVLLPGADILSSTSAALETELAKLERENDPKSVPRRLEILDLVSSREFCLGMWENSEKRATRLASLAKETHHTDFEIKGMLTLGRIFSKRGKHEDALLELNKTIQLADKFGADEIVAEAEYTIGTIFENQSKWDKAEEHFKIAGERANRANATITSSRVKSATARLLALQGKFEESLKINLELVAELERLGADDELPRIYTSIASSQKRLDHPECIDSYNKAIEIAKRVGDIRIEAYALADVSVFYYSETKQFKKAETNLKRAREIFEDLGDRRGLIGTEIHLGNLYANMSRWLDSEAQFDSALAIAREIGSKYHEAFVFFDRGKMMQSRDILEETISLYEEARRLFLEINNETMAARVEKRLVELRNK